MKFSYYYLPNSLVEKKMLPSDFAVAAFLYSMAQAYGNKNLYGIYVKVKQTTIAEACGISVESVARATKRLITSGVIISRERCVKANRHLSTYTYTLAEIGSRFFRVDRKAAKRLTAKELRCYCAFCKCKQNSSKMFFHSYSDLAKMLGMKRSELMAIVDKLISLKVIHSAIRSHHAVTLERTDTMFLSSLLGISEKSAKKGPLPKAVLTKLITQQPLENH